ATATAAPGAKLSRGILKAPPGASTRVQGTLVVDAGYMVRAGLGQVISNDGNSAVYPAASLIGNDGAGIVAQGAGNLISNDGAGIIANDGGSLIGNDGASLLAPAKGRRLFAEAGGSGDQLAAGFAIRALGLRDNRPVPLGVDAAGKPVYVVLTDAKGRYDLHLPEKLAANVRLIASPPGSTDQRATFNMLVGSAGVQDGSFTEATSLWTAYVRKVLIGSIRPAVMSDDGGHARADEVASAIGIGTTGGPIDMAYKACREEGVEKLEKPRRAFIVQRFVDAILARARLDVVGVGNQEGYEGDKNELVQHAFEDLLGQIRKGAAKALAQDPAYFNNRHYVISANARRAAAAKPGFDIRKASDVGDFIVDEYFSDSTAGHQHMAAEVLVDCGMKPEAVLHLLSANTAVGVGMAGAFLLNYQDIEPDLRAAIREQLGPDRPVVPTPPPLAPPPIAAPSPGPEHYTVSTLAGTKGQAPWHMAIGPDGNLYYVDVVTQAILKVDLAKPDRPITTVVQGLQGGLALAFDLTAAVPTLYATDTVAHTILRLLPGPVEQLKLPVGTTLGRMHQIACTKDHALIVAQDQPPAVLRISLEGDHAVTVLAGEAVGTPKFMLAQPAGLAIAPDGGIYVADSASQAVVRIDGGVRVVAGRDHNGHDDGFYDNASFANPQSLTFAPDGSLIVGDSTSAAVRRVRFALGAGVVSTLAGNGSYGAVDGEGSAARFAPLTGIAVDRNGVVYVGENQSNDIRVLTP
ncbi:MAG: putative lipoprotein, partial [Cyanobacteria bacterium RYN_339]|nr:putative lipoprotein [Cyanobacteria bacterium RYN_339]